MRVALHRWSARTAALLGGFTLVLVPFLVSVADAAWVDQVSELAQYHQRLAKFEGKAHAYEPYLAQLEKVRMALKGGDQQGTYAAMNRFMDMLQDREGGIPAWSAQELFDFSVKETPANDYDASRYGPLASTGDFDYSQGTPLWVGDGAFMLDEVWTGGGSR